MSAHESESDQPFQLRLAVWPVAKLVGVIIFLWFSWHLYKEVFNQDRTRAQQHAHSLNNLKNIVLSSHNYASQHDAKVPPYALVGPDGAENFGWSVSLLPYLEGQGLYEELDLEKSWDDPVNQKPAAVNLRIFLNPRIEGLTEESGYGLLHYAANSQVFGPGQNWSLDEISVKDGLTNTIFYGEISNHFRPWVAPGSLRDPAEGLGNGPNQFGMEGEEGIIYFAFGDGSSKPITRDVDPKILKALATPDGGEQLSQER